ncbi:MAG: hypothetical protein H6713_32885 [Myxococcales bacterium]|nr:hypothetical protein [Myxococcales bacterium]
MPLPCAPRPWSRPFAPRLLLVTPLLLALGCVDDPLGNASATDSAGPPSGGPDWDPSAGSGAGSTSTGGGSAGTSGGETTDPTATTGDPGPPQCDDEFKRCDHTFTYADNGESSVELRGDFKPDGWDNGAPLTKRGATWSVTVEIPWDAQVQYKFVLNGSEWILDPDNPDSIDDGLGGMNSLLQPTTCDPWTCAPGNIGEFDWRDAVIYFVFVDRFNNGDAGNDGPIGVEAPADWQGGDWAGVTAKITDGYFTELGVNTLWISVPADNTSSSGIGVGGDNHLYSAYHGYWPVDLEATEEHFGTMAELQGLVQAAHDAEIKVLFDYAMNHVHADSPIYANNPGWFWPNDNGNGGNCVCGEGCVWDGDQGKRCWFTDYLPDFNYSNQAARDFSVNNALWWIEQTGIDGFRLDAVKHIEDSWLLDLRAAVKAQVEPQSGEHFYMVGETFTGDKPTIKYYVGSDMLDGQFDFPLRMETCSKMLMRQGALSELEGFMNDNDGYYGPNAIMSTFIGNHDIPRIIHLAENTPKWDNVWTDGKDIAWSNTPGLPGGLEPFERVAAAFAVLLTTPGAPLIYYGDEIGLPGAGDPDNRRFMQWGGYSAGQTFLLEQVKKLTAIRAAHAATRRGARQPLSAGADTMAYRMSGEGDEVWVAVNRSDAAQSVGGLPGGELYDELNDETVSGPDVMVPARSARVLVSP